eukprot:gnl/Chilomastix_cuspidata/81.p3 GENE.gnl/Chilomastix_cuspidata/81~~gnl/Chilomastix_cuspidata/81.p3  ORF type:complete len:200 (-),score=106.53 gnl/Chilomastix_cuspidata/81:499-1098(-)
MDSVFAFVGADFVLFAADAAELHSITVLKPESEKLVELPSHKILAITGEGGDPYHFSQSVSCNVKLQELTRDAPQTVGAVASYVRNELAEAVRKAPVQVDCLIGGLDRATAAAPAEPRLFRVDYLGSMASAPYLALGYGAYFAHSLLDARWRPGLTRDDALELAAAIAKELHARFLLRPAEFAVKIAAARGVEALTLTD